MPRNVAYVDSLSKQKVSLALALFSTNLTSALEKEYGNAAKGTCKLLRMMNDYVVQPLLTTSPQKGFKTKELMVFSSVNDIRLKCFNEIAYWLQNDWYALFKSFPINNHASVIDKSVPKVSDTHISDNVNLVYNETMQYFWNQMKTLITFQNHQFRIK